MEKHFFLLWAHAFQGLGLRCQFSSEHFPLNILQKNIMCHSLGQKIHPIFWRLRVARDCMAVEF